MRPRLVSCLPQLLVPTHHCQSCSWAEYIYEGDRDGGNAGPNEGRQQNDEQRGNVSVSEEVSGATQHKRRFEDVKEGANDAAKPWQGMELLAARLQAVPYVSSFLAQLTHILLRIATNKVPTFSETTSMPTLCCSYTKPLSSVLLQILDAMDTLHWQTECQSCSRRYCLVLTNRA